jgi:hypothetical protein
MYLPNTIVIGAMKSGTTSLHAYLNKHPQIFMSAKKEIDFFCHDEKYSEGIEYYKSFFPENTKIRGESSQNYSKFHWFEDVPKRIYKDLGKNMKFIYILRDPVKRIYSHYNEMQAQNCAPPNLEAYIKKELNQNEIVLTSCYKQQLDKFLEFYPLSHFKIITLEALQKNRLSVLNEVFDFLGVEQMTDDTLFDFASNTSRSKKMRTDIGMALIKNPVAVFVKKILPISIKEKIKSQSTVKNLMFQGIKKDIKLSDELEEELRAIFKKDTDKLRKLTGLSFDDWSV